MYRFLKKYKMKKTILAILLASQFGVAQVISEQAESKKIISEQVEITPKPAQLKAKDKLKAKKKTPSNQEIKVVSQKSSTIKKDSPEKPKTVFHVVEAKQTLYFLLKKYNTKEADFLAANPGFDKTMPMKIGQKLTFKPQITPAKVVVTVKPTEKTQASVNTKQEPTITQKTALKSTENKQLNLPDEAYHVVQAKETIFSLTKKYGLDITEFVEANNLTDNVIKPGQKLIIDKTEIQKQKTLFEKAKEPIYVQKQVGRKIVEEGIAQVVKTKSRTNKFLALHRTAKSGSIIKVTNEANGTAIFAKIVGNMNAVGPDQNIMLKLSPLAYYQLKPKDSKMRAKIEYFSPM